MAFIIKAKANQAKSIHLGAKVSEPEYVCIQAEMEND